MSGKVIGKKPIMLSTICTKKCRLSQASLVDRTALISLS